MPVLNDDGTLVGGISEESLASFENVDYATTLAKHPVLMEEKTKSYSLTCDANMTVGDAADRLLKNNTHHVWIVGDKKEILGVVTWRNVLNLFIPKLE